VEVLEELEEVLEVIIEPSEEELEMDDVVIAEVLDVS
jgi:hypothetical protein